MATPEQSATTKVQPKNHARRTRRAILQLTANHPTPPQKKTQRKRHGLRTLPILSTRAHPLPAQQHHRLPTHLPRQHQQPQHHQQRPPRLLLPGHRPPLPAAPEPLLPAPAAAPPAAARLVRRGRGAVPEPARDARHHGGRRWGEEFEGRGEGRWRWWWWRHGGVL